MSIDFDEELYPHMLTAIAGRRWVIGHGLCLATMKCAESLKMRQAFADVVSARIAKGMSEGLKPGVEHGHAQRTIESLEAYDPKAEAKFSAALQSLKDLKLPLLDQLEGLKDAPMDVIMASLYLEDDTGEGCSTIYTRPPSQLLSARHPGISRASSRRSSSKSKFRRSSSSLFTTSTAVVRYVGIPISAGMTASVPYVREKGVSPWLDFTIVRNLTFLGPSGKGPAMSIPHL
uniref:Transposase (Putative), gypsy type n=1 Tax=Tanacetum cinerariifolium TaxID=118510 RepID=A0A6L2KYP2_TANCI|nr:hypothetical protein [Tanacetum cinerariifolium]